MSRKMKQKQKNISKMPRAMRDRAKLEDWELVAVI